MYRPPSPEIVIAIRLVFLQCPHKTLEICGEVLTAMCSIPLIRGLQGFRKGTMNNYSVTFQQDKIESTSPLAIAIIVGAVRPYAKKYGT